MLDASEVDRIAHVTGLPIMRLVDWKNRAAEPFELRATPREAGLFQLDLNTPQPVTVPSALPLVHGDFETRKDESGVITYVSKPGNSMGQAAGNDGRPAFGVAYDATELDAEGRVVFKVYFGPATEWFVKNVYHAKWNELREARAELEPDAAPKPPTDERVGKERGRNPRDAARAQQRGGQGGGQRGGGRGRRGGRGRGGN